jgi:hypothetical protein
MTNKKSVVGYTLLFIVIMILILFSNYISLKNCRRYITDLSFNGHIVRKYIDNKEHNYPILEVSTLEHKLQKINLSLEYSGLFEYVQTNDSIIKFSGSLKVMVYRNSIDTIFILNKKCIGF